LVRVNNEICHILNKILLSDSNRYNKTSVNKNLLFRLFYGRRRTPSTFTVHYLLYNGALSQFTTITLWKKYFCRNAPIYKTSHSIFVDFNRQKSSPINFVLVEKFTVYLLRQSKQQKSMVLILYEKNMKGKIPNRLGEKYWLLDFTNCLRIKGNHRNNRNFEIEKLLKMF
jgi:uncharacterized membrane protein